MKEASQEPRILMYHGVITEWSALPQEREVGAQRYDVNLNDF